MSEFDELIYNLFIMHFWVSNYYEDVIPFDEFAYDFNLQNRDFLAIKDCFPKDEYFFDMMFNIHLGGKCKCNYVHEELE